MTKERAIKLFEQKQIRSIWKEEDEKWYFPLRDVRCSEKENIFYQRAIYGKYFPLTYK